MKTGKSGYLNLALWCVGLGCIVYIYQSKTISNTAIVPVLGGLCAALGLLALIDSRANGRPVPRQALLQLAMGAVILIIGLVELSQAELPQFVWYILLALILLLLVGFALFRYKWKK